MASAGRSSGRSLQSDRSSARSVGSAQHYDAEAHGCAALGGFGLLLRTGVSQRLETQGQSIFFAAKVDKGGPAYSAGMRDEDMLMSVDGQRLKTWDDAARLLLGNVGSSAAVAWAGRAATFEHRNVQHNYTNAASELRSDGRRAAPRPGPRHMMPRPVDWAGRWAAAVRPRVCRQPSRTVG